MNENKKTYKHPSIEIIQLETSAIIADSFKCHDEYNSEIGECDQLSNKRESIWDSMNE